MDQAVGKLMQQLHQNNTRFAQAENTSQTKVPALLDPPAFTNVVGTITHYAIELIAPEWAAARNLEPSVAYAIECTCELVARLALPCRHRPLSYYQERPIPLSLVHPRLWLDGPSTAGATWTMEDQPILDQGPEASVDRLAGRGEILSQHNLAQHIEFQRRVEPEHAERFALLSRRITQQLQRQFNQATTQLFNRQLPTAVPSDRNSPLGLLEA